MPFPGLSSASAAAPKARSAATASDPHIDLLKELVTGLFPASGGFATAHAAAVRDLTEATEPNSLHTVVEHVDKYISRAILTTIVTVSGANVNTMPVQLLREVVVEGAKFRALIHAVLASRRMPPVNPAV